MTNTNLENQIDNERMERMKGLALKTVLVQIGHDFRDEILPYSNSVIVTNIGEQAKQYGHLTADLINLEKLFEIEIKEEDKESLATAFRQVPIDYAGVRAVIPLRRGALPSRFLDIDTKSNIVYFGKPIDVNLSFFNPCWVQLNSGLIIEKYVAERAGMNSQPYDATKKLVQPSEFIIKR